MFILTKRLIYAIDEILAGLALSVIIVLTVVGVFCRYVLNQPIAWQEEVSVVTVVWLVFMGASVVARQSMHIRIDSLIRLLPPTYQQVWAVVVNGLILLVLGCAFIYATQLTLQTQKLTTILKIHYRYVYGAAPISLGLMIGHTVKDLVRSIRRRRRGH